MNDQFTEREEALHSSSKRGREEGLNTQREKVESLLLYET